MIEVKNSICGVKCLVAGFACALVVVCTLSAAVSCVEQPRQQGRITTALKLSIRVSEGRRQMHDPAEFLCVFANNGASDIVLPTGRIGIHVNLFPDLYANRTMASAANCAAGLSNGPPPFRFGDDRYVVLKPGESFELRLGGLPWQAFRKLSEKDRIGNAWKDTGKFYLTVCFTGEYEPTELRGVPSVLAARVWRSPVRSEPIEIDFGG